MTKLIICILYHLITCFGNEGVLVLERVHVWSNISEKKVVSDIELDGKALSCKTEVIFVEKEIYSLQECGNQCNPSNWSDNCQYQLTGDNIFLSVGFTCNGLTYCNNFHKNLKSWFYYILENMKSFFNESCAINSNSTIITATVEYSCVKEDKLVNICHDFKGSFPKLNLLWLGGEKRHLPLQCSCNISGSKLKLTTLLVFIRNEDVSMTVMSRRKKCHLNPNYRYNKDVSCSMKNMKTFNISVTARTKRDKFWIRVESDKQPYIECRAFGLEETTVEERNLSTFPEIQATYSPTYTPKTNNSTDVYNQQRGYIDFGILTGSLAAGFYLAVVMVAGALYGVSRICRCYKTYMQLNMKNPEVTNNYTEINHSRSPIRSPESTTKPLYENCTDLSSSIQQESFLYDNCRNLGDVVIIDTRHSYAEVLDGRISQRTENHLYVNT